MSALDLWMPRFDAREHHASHGVAVPPAETLRRALAMPLAPDAIVRTLFRLRGLSARGTLEEFFAQGAVLERGAGSYVVGLLAGRGGFLPVASAEAWRDAPPPHALKIVVGPFSALIRRRWLRAIVRACAER